MWPVKTPSLIKLLYPSLVWDIPTRDKELFLTFDDGPDPEVTPLVLDILKSYQATATFFCLGKNVTANPELFERIRLEGHSIGNHTFNHLNGWKSDNDLYYTDINKAKEVIPSTLFRPPYGKLTSSQIRKVSTEYKIIMWDILSYDFNQKHSDYHYRQVLNHSKPGSVLVFHDSQKAKKNVLSMLPKLLSHFNGLGYSFKAIAEVRQ